jgi:hypothetical protein
MERQRREEIGAVRSLARAQSKLASRNALDNALDEQRRGPEETPRERELESRRQILNRLSRQEGRCEGPYSAIPAPYMPRHAHAADAETQLRHVPLHLLRMLIRETLRTSESLVRLLEIAPGKYGSTSYTLRA